LNQDSLVALELWYANQCNGDWEHDFGVKIDTLDNPGWTVDIDLAGTTLSGRAFIRIEEEREEHDWVFCWVEADVFKGRGGPRNLTEILTLFDSWLRR
jgi:hypothetical protein